MSKKLMRKKLALMLSTLKKKRKFFCEVEYLESTGTQWIDTGINVDTSTDEIKLYFELTETQNYKWFFGEYDNNARLGLGTGDGANKRNFLYQQSATKVSDTQMYDKQHLFEINSNGGFLDGTKIRDYVNFASTSTIYLFNLNIDSPSDYRCKSKIWRYEHKRNGVLIRDLIPVLDWNYTPCMYDKVSGQLFYNQGTGTFQYGREIHYVDYLESTGTQYIDTGYIPTNTTGQYAKMQYTTVNNSVTFGCMVSGNGAVGPYYAASSGTVGWWTRWGSKEPRVIAPTPTTTDTYEMYLNFNNDRIARVDSTVIEDNLGNISGNYPTLTLFKRNYTVGGNLTGKVFNYKITEGTNLVRDYIPCIDENGVGFMFDRVTHTIFDNAGTGAFVPASYQLDENGRVVEPEYE